MDLGTVPSNVECGRYTAFGDFRADVELIWRNAAEYNGADSLIATLAAQLRAWFRT
jgi:hypothetical protein